MIKTIKVKRRLRLDELIKYIFDNGIKDKGFRIYDEFEDERYLTVSQQGMIRLGFGFYPEDTFTVEVEEEISPYTRFEKVVVIYRTNHDREIKSGVRNKIKIIEILHGYGDSNILKIYALLDESLELIWERGEND